jgi:hypothetical protein
MRVVQKLTNKVGQEITNQVALEEVTLAKEPFLGYIFQRIMWN